MKKLLFISILSCFVLMYGCTQNENNPTASEDLPGVSVYQTSDGTIVYENSKLTIIEGSLIERDINPKEVSSPSDSITFEKAAALLNSCNFEDLYLPQSTKDYEKYYFDTVTYNNELFYSVDLYLNSDNKKIFVGTNCLVACDGSKVLKKTWSSDYISVELNSSSSDKVIDEIYPNVKITPNDALIAFSSFGEKKLGLENDFSSYTFEIDTKIYDIKSIKCYQLTPKLYYNNQTKMLPSYYITVDGSNRVFINDKENIGSYIEIK